MVVALLVRWQIIFFVSLYWMSNPALDKVNVNFLYQFSTLQFLVFFKKLLGFARALGGFPGPGLVPGPLRHMGSRGLGKMLRYGAPHGWEGREDGLRNLRCWCSTAFCRWATWSPLTSHTTKLPVLEGLTRDRTSPSWASRWHTSSEGVKCGAMDRTGRWKLTDHSSGSFPSGKRPSRG